MIGSTRDRTSVTAALAVVMLVAVAVLVFATPALSYDESSLTYPDIEPNHNDPGAKCYDCHTRGCTPCHNTRPALPESAPAYQGPHGTYDSSTDKCDICHTVHVADGSLELLPADTIKAVCETCHDGTQGRGVYGAIVARGGTVGGGHSIDATNVIPGGDAGTGGAIVATFTGEMGYLSCDDCHSPHDSQTVEFFYSDRMRSWPRPGLLPLGNKPVPNSSKLLRRLPSSATTPTADYGSDWCLGCHGGRSSGGVVHNHPVESTATVATPYTYANLPVVTADTPVGTTVLAQLGGHTWNRGSSNRGYLMPMPRTAQQTGHLPICQQCHEDARDVGDLTAAGLADAEPSVITTPDGWVATDNPRFQNFPHETENTYMLVETGDDLCLNCHTTAGLP